MTFTPDPSLYPFASRWFDSSAGRVHYVDEGSGTPLLLCHGNPTWSFLYRTIVLALRDRFRCIAVDYLGFGLSDRPATFGCTAAAHADVVGELVDHLGLDGFVLMGQDWGGPIGTTAALERADRVRGIVLGNTWLWPATPSFRAFSVIMSSPPLQSAITRRNFFVRRLMPLATTRRYTAAELHHYEAAQPAPRRAVAEFPRQIRAARPLLARLAHEVPDALGGKPVLLVWGTKDFALRASLCVPRMTRMFPDHVVTPLPAANHYIQEDAPDAIAEAIVRRFA